MASTTRASSFLPTIKCSNCSVEIPISLMAEHICAPAPPLPESRLKALDGPFAPPSKINMPPPPRSTKTPPPRLNASSTFNSFLHSNHPPPSLPSSNTSVNSRSASPVVPANGRKPPYQLPSRSVTSPLPPKPPSPDLVISQDSAFPIFPTSKSRSATPTTPSEASFPFRRRSRSRPRQQNEDEVARALLVSRETGGVSVTPKPNGNNPRPLQSPEQSGSRQKGHKKTSSMSSSKDFNRHPSAGTSRSQLPRLSTSSSNYTKNLSVSSTSGSARFTLERSKTEVPAVPAMPAPPQPPDDHQDKTNKYASVESTFDFGTFGQDNRSQTFPVGDDPALRSEEQTSFHRRPSEPSPRSHKPRPSIAAAAMLPLHEIGSTSSFKPSKSIRGRPQAPTLDRTMSAPSHVNDGKETKDETRLADAPPLPLSAKVQKHDLGNPYHTPHESTSSNESFSSGRKTGSSRSSPPLNDSPKRSNTNSTEHRNDDLFNAFQFDVGRRPSFDDQTSSTSNYEAGYLKPRPTKPPDTVRPTIPTLSSYAEPPNHNDSPSSSPEDYLVPTLKPNPDNLRISPTPPSTLLSPESSSHHRPRIPNKGNCRGCNEVIKGKSVSSADGRLTGRYHKACFVCKTCAAPFQTADFYVMNNHPYCARHYHELNDSLCKNCDRGIEGQYVETDGKHGKFHTHCFSCQECHRILRHDYFEWNGRTLCEQHAFRAAQQPSSLGPGRRFPERRTTKLMMM